MPVPIFERDEETMNRLFVGIAQTIADEVGVAREELFMPLSPGSERWGIDLRVAARIEQETGATDVTHPSSLPVIIEHYYGMNLEQALEESPEAYTRYRTFLNSLQIVTKNGKEIILLPRYRPVSEAERPVMARLESEVEAIYHLARPQAELRWVDCSNVIMYFGAVHCMAITIPVVE